MLSLFGGGIGIFGFADLANVWIGFSVFALENYGFSVWGFPRFADFLQFSVWFSVFVNNDGVFSDFFVQSFTIFLVLPRKLHPAVAGKPVSNSK